MPPSISDNKTKNSTTSLFAVTEAVPKPFPPDQMGNPKTCAGQWRHIAMLLNTEIKVQVKNNAVQGRAVQSGEDSVNN